MTAVERVRQRLQLRSDEVPVLQRLLQSGGNAAGVAGAAQIARDDSEMPVARAVVERGQFHAGKYGGFPLAKEQALRRSGQALMPGAGRQKSGSGGSGRASA